jgi:hypothetical protein
MTLPARLKKFLITSFAVAVPVACLLLFIGWDMSRLLIIGLVVLFVVRGLILFLARSKVGLVILVLGSVLIIAVYARHDPRGAGTAAGFAILAMLPGKRKEGPNQTMQPTADRRDAEP